MHGIRLLFGAALFELYYSEITCLVTMVKYATVLKAFCIFTASSSSWANPSQQVLKAMHFDLQVKRGYQGFLDSKTNFRATGTPGQSRRNGGKFASCICMVLP